MRHYTSWVAHLHRTRLDPRGEELIQGLQGKRVHVCVYHPDTRPICTFCHRVFPDSDTYIDHLMMTRRNRDSGILKTVKSTWATATSKIVMHTEHATNERSNYIENAKITFGQCLPFTAFEPEIKSETYFREASIYDASTERSTLTPFLSNMRLTDSSIAPNFTSGMWHEFAECGIKIEPELY